MRVLRRLSLLSLIDAVKSRRLSPLAVVIFVGVAFVVVGIRSLVATGVLEYDLGDLTLSKWMELLLIPISLVIIATFLQLSENRTDRRIAEERRRSDREIADERVQQETLNGYLDSMGTFIVSDGLDNERGMQVMRARTAATLRVLARVQHRNAVFGFLRDANLLGVREKSSVDDSDPNQTQAESRKPVALLQRLDLSEADLRRADLRRADMTGAHLSGADITGASLWGADLTEAILRRTDLTGAGLTGANLTGADLMGANLTRAVLRGADLTGTELARTDLAKADLTGAVLTETFAYFAGGKLVTSPYGQLAQARTLEGATLPDGTVIKNDEQWRTSLIQHS